MLRCQTVFCVTWLALLMIASPDVVGARDYFLTIGGGYHPAANQASLERNVLFLGKLLDEQKPNSPRDVFFSDGNSPGRDVQYEDPKRVVPRVNRLLARVFRREKHLGFQYRSHSIEEVRGQTSRENLKLWFDSVGGRLAKGDRLFLYVTAHGGSGDKTHPQNTSIYLWNGQKLRMTELVDHLDQLSPDVRVVTVMVQCYAGGFANLLYNHGAVEHGFSQANRSGFFATVHNRPAAGCTTDVRNHEHPEYSTFFWAALRGRSPTDETIERPDYDGDGLVTFDEAHSYAVLMSDTIDIPIKTSGLLLRRHSQFFGEHYPGLFSVDTPYEQLLSLASPKEHAVIDGLSAQLGLEGIHRGSEAKKIAHLAIVEKRRIEADRKKRIADYGLVCRQIQKHLLLGWPELSNRWNPQVDDYLTIEATAIVEAIESHDRYADFVELHDRITQLTEERLEQDRRWAKSQRLLREIENVVLAANLPSVASMQVQRRYHRLLEAEHLSLIEPTFSQSTDVQ